MADLRTEFMGLPLSSPLVAGPSPLTASLTTLRALARHGAAAVVLPTLYEDAARRETNRQECLCDAGVDCCHEVSGSYFPEPSALAIDGIETYLRLVSNARDVVDVPVIASICAASREGWVDLARRVTDAGSHAIELNMAKPVVDAARSGEDVERALCDTIVAVKRATGLPVAVRVNSSFTAFAHVALRLADSGADAIVLFQRVHYPDVDLSLLQWRHEVPLEGGTVRDARRTLTWIARLHRCVGAGVAAVGGVHSADDVVKGVLAGADVLLAGSAPLLEGPAAIAGLIDGLDAWLRDRGFDSVDQARGLLSVAGGGITEQDPMADGRRKMRPMPVVSDTEL